jgi:ATP-dependent Lhr-like helicase
MGAMISDGRLDLAELFDEDMLGDDLDAWLDESWTCSSAPSGPVP